MHKKPAIIDNQPNNDLDEMKCYYKQFMETHLEWQKRMQELPDNTTAQKWAVEKTILQANGRNVDYEKLAQYLGEVASEGLKLWFNETNSSFLARGDKRNSTILPIVNSIINPHQK